MIRSGRAFRWPFGKTGSFGLAILALSTSTLGSCGTDPVVIDPASRQAYFDLVAWGAFQDSSLAGRSLFKRVRVDGVEQEALLDTVDWTEELSPFTLANINKPALIGRYQVDSTTTTAGQLQINYRALDPTLKTQRLRIECRGRCSYGQVTRVEISSGTASLIADTEQELTWTPDTFRITSRQDALLVASRELTIEGRLTPP